MTDTFIIRAIVNDGTGVATIWKVRQFKIKADEFVESIGTVVAVHTEAEAIAAWNAQS